MTLMDIGIDTDGCIKKVMMVNFIDPFVRAVKLTIDDVIFDNEEDYISKELFFLIEKNNSPTNEEILNYLKVIKVYIDSCRNGKVDGRHLRTIYRSMAFFASIYIGGERKRNTVSKGDYELDTKQYVADLLEYPLYPNNFIEKIVQLGVRNSKKNILPAKTSRPISNYTLAGQRNPELFELSINGRKVTRCKHTSPSFNGEFMAYFITEDEMCYFCNCEYRNGRVTLITTIESSIGEFEQL